MTYQLDLHHDGRTHLQTDGGRLTEFTIGHGDRQPPLEATLYGPDDDPLALGDARRVRFRLWPHTGGQLAVDASAEITDADAGRVRYEWGRGDTDARGVYKAAFVVTTRDGDQLTVPNGQPITVTIQ